jgi:peroxiredoxin
VVGESTGPIRSFFDPTGRTTMTADPNHVAVGTPAPAFDLPTIDGGKVRSSDIDADVLVVAFLCNHCPYVKHVEATLGHLAGAYDPDEVAFVGICSNDVATYPDDAPERLREQSERAGWSFPYGVDESQEVAMAYRAACTPDFFVYDRERRLVYRGAMDESSPRNGQPLTGDDLRRAIEHTLVGESVPEPHIPPLGCGIKWKPGNAPA